MSVVTMADANRLAYVGSKTQVREQGSAEGDDWYTPKAWLDIAGRVLGKIDLDPFSSEMANERVRAARIFTQQDSAFDHEWNADTVWMNPPYSRGLCAAACDKFILEHETGSFKSGIILVNNMTDTQWFRRLMDKCARFVLVTKRIAFENAAGQVVSGNTRGQAFFLFTKSPKVISRFDSEMRKADQLVLIVDKNSSSRITSQRNNRGA